MSILLIKADARHLPLANDSVHMVICSPPYFGLRDYGVANQLGLEKSPEDYVANLVEVFREVRRVLRPDGTVWLNLGDSYAAQRSGTHQPAETLAGGSHGKTDNGEVVNRGRFSGYNPTRNAAAIGLKHKDLIMIPARVALALQADGWWLRSDIIWAKPNPMPESVRDRPTVAHEHVFLLTKSVRYFYDADAVREPHARLWNETNGGSWSYGKGDKQRVMERGKAGTHSGAYPLPNPLGRNRRSVWTIATEPTPYAHFATYPRKLVEPCIQAGTSERGCCSSCGAPWKRLTKTQVLNMSNAAKAGTIIEGKGHPTNQVREDHDIRNGPTTSTETLGWQPTCSCNQEPKPCVVLDPFCGSGTTLEVAEKLGRNSVGVDLSYQDVVRLRLQKAKLEKAA